MTCISPSIFSFIVGDFVWKIICTGSERSTNTERFWNAGNHWIGYARMCSRESCSGLPHRSWIHILIHFCTVKEYLVPFLFSYNSSSHLARYIVLPHLYLYNWFDSFLYWLITRRHQLEIKVALHLELELWNMEKT